LNSTKAYKPKLFVVISRFPYPIDKGDKLRAYYQIRDLSQTWEIYLHCISEINIEQAHFDHVKQFCQELKVYRLVKWRIYFNSLLAFLGKKPVQVGYFYQNKIAKHIHQSLVETKPQHVFCQLVRAAEYVKNYHDCNKTIDYMDALSEGVRKRIQSGNLLFRIILKSEWRRLLRYENLIFDYFENHLIISAQDQQLIAHNKRNTIQIVPNGVGEHFFAEPNDISDEYDIVFVGNLSYAPNILAVEFIVNKILPYAQSKGVFWKVYIAGANPGKQVLSLVNPSVKIEGWVEDIRTAYLKGKLFVAPMFIGTGLQNKLLEAMAMGKPCISSSLAKSAFENENPIEAANKVEEFYEKIHFLLNNISTYEKIKQKSTTVVHTYFDWKTNNEN
jgi:glycosyltransferase involved in cell wall biosynthesis